MDDFVVLGSENCGVGDKSKGEKMEKGSIAGTVTRRRLADISNLPQQPKTLSQDDTAHPISLSTKEYVDKLHKENMALMKHLSDRNKIIELSGIELQKLRINLQKVQQQNLQLAQANSHMLAELNSGKDRLKALHHELGCKNGLLKARNFELEETAKRATFQETGNEVRTKCDKAGESSQTDKGDNNPCNTNRRRQSKSQSLGPSVKQVEAKEKAENKRLCLRRQSARFKSEDHEPTQDLFEISTFSACPSREDSMHENGRTSAASSVKKEDKEGNSDTSFEAQAFQRTSIGRPLRRAAERVQSYKEIPLNVKMRRSE